MSRKVTRIRRVVSAAETGGGARRKPGVYCDFRRAAYLCQHRQDIALVCESALGSKANACLVRNHGVVCLAGNMADCFKVAIVLEMVAELYYKIRTMNRNFVPLSEENIRTMQEFVKTKYGQTES